MEPLVLDDSDARTPGQSSPRPAAAAPSRPVTDAAPKPAASHGDELVGHRINELEVAQAKSDDMLSKLLREAERLQSHLTYQQTSQNEINTRVNADIRDMLKGSSDLTTELARLIERMPKDAMPRVEAERRILAVEATAERRFERIEQDYEQLKDGLSGLKDQVGGVSADLKRHLAIVGALIGAIMFASTLWKSFGPDLSANTAAPPAVHQTVSAPGGARP